MRRLFKDLGGVRSLTWALAALLGLSFGSVARASLILDISSDVGTSIEFTGSGTGATFKFNNNGSGQGFGVTASTGVGDSVGLHGTIGGAYSYTTASIVSVLSLQTAPVSSSGGTFTITDASLNSLTGTIAGVDVVTIGVGGLVNMNGAINLSNITYGGTNSDLKKLRDETNATGGLVAISFQFSQGESLTQLAASGGDITTSYSGTIMTASAPEPSTLVLGCIGALGLIGYGLRRRKVLGV
jgi:hypothetical protein